MTPETTTDVLSGAPAVEQGVITEILVGLVDSVEGEQLAPLAEKARLGLTSFAQPSQVALAHRVGLSPLPTSLTGQADAIRVMTFSSAVDASMTVSEQYRHAFHGILGLARTLNSRVCVVLSSHGPDVSQGWFSALVEPIVAQGIDLVTPCYGRHRFEGLLNLAILNPLTRALYGKRIFNPLGPDLGLSAALVRQLASVSANASRSGLGSDPLLVVGAEAAVKGARIAQTYLGERRTPPADWQNLSGLLVELLTPLFLNIERDVVFWQRIRASEAIPTYGPETVDLDDSPTVDVRPLIQSFQLGLRNLREIWGLVLPPSVMLELQKLARATLEGFRLSNTLWANIVYDFALAFHVRTISRDHLLRAMTPLYLGWVASFANEAETSERNSVQSQEMLCQAFEAAKPYLVSRWRWPDRFNP